MNAFLLTMEPCFEIQITNKNLFIRLLFIFQGVLSPQSVTSIYIPEILKTSCSIEFVFYSSFWWPFIFLLNVILCYISCLQHIVFYFITQSQLRAFLMKIRVWLSSIVYQQKTTLCAMKTSDLWMSFSKYSFSL